MKGLARAFVIAVGLAVVVAILLSDNSTDFWPPRPITAGIVSSALVISFTAVVVDRVLEGRRRRRQAPLLITALDDAMLALSGTAGAPFEERPGVLRLGRVQLPTASSLQHFSDDLGSFARIVREQRTVLVDCLARWGHMVGTAGLGPELLAVADTHRQLVVVHEVATWLSREALFNQADLLRDGVGWEALYRLHEELVAAVERYNSAAGDAYSRVERRIGALLQT